MIAVLYAGTFSYRPELSLRVWCVSLCCCWFQQLSIAETSMMQSASSPSAADRSRISKRSIESTNDRRDGSGSGSGSGSSSGSSNGSSESDDVGNGKVGQQQHSASAEMVTFLVCVGGIYGSYIIYGFLQEKISTFVINEETQETYSDHAFLILGQCICNALWSLAVCLLWKVPLDRTPLRYYAAMSVSYLGGMFFSYVAMQLINYPSTVLLKSSKLIPVLIMQRVMFNRVVRARQYMFAILLSVGIALFLLKPQYWSTLLSFSAKRDGDWSDTLMVVGGVAMAFGSLICDGATGAMQDAWLPTTQPSPHRLMLWINLCGAIITFPFALLVNDQFRHSVAVLTRFPLLTQWFLLFWAVSAIGQNFIFYTVRRFSALTCASITVTRKFITICISVLWFNHPVTLLQWGGAGLVFFALTAELGLKYLSQRRAEQQQEQLAATIEKQKLA